MNTLERTRDMEMYELVLQDLTNEGAKRKLKELLEQEIDVSR